MSFRFGLKHLLLVIAVIVTVGIVYVKVPGTYFCAYDDFIELHRAAFEDSEDHSRIVTTSHFDSYRYRPLNRAVNFITYRADDANPEFFRTRNLTFHLLNVILIYLLAWKLFGSIRISSVGALLFGLHPLANQTIIGAVDTNSMSHAAFLGALLMLMRSVDSIRWPMWLTGSIFSGWLGLMAYDSGIVVFALMFLWLILNWTSVRERLNHTRFLMLFFVVSGSLLTSYFLLRQLYVPQGLTRAASDLPSGGIILKNSIMYIGSLLLPIDVVLANQWLNTPLPSEIPFTMSWAILSFACLAVIGIGLGVLWFPWLKTHISGVNYKAVIFLLAGIFAPLLPVLVLQSRPSETYLYLPVGFYAVLLSYGLAKASGEAGRSKPPSFYIPAVIVLIALFSSGTWVRNDRVFNCGQTARRILYELPQELLRTGQWKVSFANVAGESGTRRYGFYGFRGVDTIGHGAPANWAITSALQLVFKNDLLIGEIVDPQQLIANCRATQDSNHLCVWVHSDGRLESVTRNSMHVSSTPCSSDIPVSPARFLSVDFTSVERPCDTRRNFG
jgi:hypothetical protein